jgi:hypothetical protein
MSDDWWTERQQNKRLAGLEEDLSHVSSALSQARASQSRLNAELSKVRGSLEERLNRLSSAFDAFVEISDLRVTLGLFDAHGRVRHQAKQLLVGSLVDDVADADGYWLAPALVALRGVSDGAVDAEALSLATARDPLRVGAFHVLLAAVSGGRVPSFADALPSLADPVPMYQRAMWLLAADGFFGPEGWAGCVSVVGTHADDALAETIASLAKPSTPSRLPKELDAAVDLGTALQACEKLTALRTWVTETLDKYTGERADAADPVARRALELLVDEGSPIELPLLARERELRGVIEGKATASSTWDSPVGSAVDLVREDLSAEQPGRRALAVRACAPVVLSLGEKYEAAARVEPPSSVEVRTRYGQVLITSAAPDPGSLSTAVEMVDRVSQVDSTRRRVVYGAAVVAVVFAVLAIVAGWGWVFVALVAGGVAAYQWFEDRSERRKAVESAVQLKQALRDDVAHRVEAFAKARRELQDRQARVTEDMAALRGALATVAG